MESNVTIIPFEEKYHDQMVELLEEFYQYIIHVDPMKRLVIKPGYGENELKNIKHQTTNEEGIFLLAVTDTEIAGFATATIYRQTPEDLLGTVPSTIARVTNLYVSALNREKGLGTTLLKKVEEYARSKNCDIMKIEVFAANEPARKFYAKHGYEVRSLDQIKKL